MTDNNEKNLIVVKRKKTSGHGHHGGAWKIAYADFVTAMMAFFLLMWLINSLEKDTLQGIAEYFQTPINGIGKGGPGISEKMRVVDSGGGDKKNKKIGEVILKTDAVTKKSIDAKEALKLAEQKELEELQNLKNNIDSAIDSNPALKKMKNQLLLDITTEGLRIQIIDQENRPMFDVGSTSLKTYTKDLLRSIGKTLNQVSNKIVISGHTDSLQYAGDNDNFTNWELSTERANAARRELILGGMDENKVMRIVGVASTSLLDKDHPNAASNRRISILVLDKTQEQSLLKT